MLNKKDMNMRKTIITTVVFCAAFLTSCSTLGMYSKSDIMSVQAGMTKQEIIQKFGKPDFRSFADNVETLDFNAWYVSSSDYYTIVRVRFENDTVVGMESFPLRSVVRDKR